jgi:hypothetical protein
MTTCKYCEIFQNTEAQKDGRKFCPLTKKEVDKKTKACIYINPKNFYCDNYALRLKLIQCINRRRNEPEFEQWKSCRNCNQFEKEIKPIILKYYIEAKRIRIPLSLKKTNTTKAQAQISIMEAQNPAAIRAKLNGPAVNPPKPARSIKRRSATTKEKAQSNRVIKRRKTNKTPR